MRIPLDGLDIEIDGFCIAEQAFSGFALISDNGSVYSIELRGLKQRARGYPVTSKDFDLEPGSPLFKVISDAVVAHYGDRIREWRDLPKSNHDEHALGSFELLGVR
jgi:hypothetical protein